MASSANTATSQHKAKIAVLGASGYTGAELVRLLLRHPRVELAVLTADRRAGQEMREVFPQFAPFGYLSGREGRSPSPISGTRPERTARSTATNGDRGMRV